MDIINSKISNIIELYKAGKSLKEIANEYNTYPNKIRRLILQYNPNFKFRSQFQKKREPTKHELLNARIPDTYSDYKQLLLELNTSDTQILRACLYLIKDQESIIEKQKQIIRDMLGINCDYDT